MVIYVIFYSMPELLTITRVSIRREAVAWHAATGVGAWCVHTVLVTHGSTQSAFINICQQNERSCMIWGICITAYTCAAEAIAGWVVAIIAGAGVRAICVAADLLTEMQSLSTLVHLCMLTTR